MRSTSFITALVLPLVAAAGLSFSPAVSGQERVEPVQPVGSDELQSDFSAQATVGANVGIRRVLEKSFDVGPFRITPGLGAGAGVESVATGSDSLRLDASFFVDTGPQLDIVLPLGAQHRFSVSGSAIYRSYTSTRPGRPNGWWYDAAGGYEFTGERLSAAATYQYSLRPESNLDAIDQGGIPNESELDERVWVDRRTLGGRAQFEVGNSSFIGVQASQQDIDYDPGNELMDPMQSMEFDRVDSIVGGSYGRRVASWATVQLGAQATQSAYLPEFEFRDNYTARAYVQGTFASARRLTGSAAVGVERRSVDNAEFDSHTGPYVNAAVRFGVTDRLGLWVLGLSRTQPSFWENNVYSIDRQIGGGLDFQVLRSVNLRGLVRFGTLIFPEPTEFELPDGSIFSGNREDSTTQYEGTLTWNVFGQNIGGTLGYRTRESNVESVRTRGFFVRLNLAASFGKQF